MVLVVAVVSPGLVMLVVTLEVLAESVITKLLLVCVKLGLAACAAAKLL